MIINQGKVWRKERFLTCWLVLLSAASISGFSTSLHHAGQCNQKGALAARHTTPLCVALKEVLSSSPCKSSTALHMVLTTPESIIEQASTQKLIDDLIDECVRTSARRPIMLQFDPSSNFIWKRWKGTIFSETWDSVIKRMAYATIVLIVCHSVPQVKTWLSGFGILWGQLLSVTTFTLTFFVNQSYALWRKCYDLSRRLQGRLHDINLTLAAHAVRKPPTNPNEPSTYTAGSRQVLELVSRYVRLFNILTYGSFTRSHRPILTPRGMRRLVERGLMTAREREILVDADIPATQRHTAVLLWIVRTYVEGREAGHFLGGAGFEDQILEKCHVARAQYGAIGDELQGRMPLAYAHIVQVLVDLILCMYPWMAYTSGMSSLITVMGIGLLTISYQGLFDLAKQLLDPYENESYGKGEDPLVVDTLIAETNAGSVRWLNGLEQYPVSHQKVKDAELSDMQLPLRGYTVEEAEELEAERLRKERERAERKALEDLENQKRDQEARILRNAAEAMIPARVTEVPLVDGLLSQLDIAVHSSKSASASNSGFDLARTMKPLPYSTGESVSTIVSHMPDYADIIAGDILPKGIPLALEPIVSAQEAVAMQVGCAANFIRSALPSVDAIAEDVRSPNLIAKGIAANGDGEPPHGDENPVRGPPDTSHVNGASVAANEEVSGKESHVTSPSAEDPALTSKDDISKPMPATELIEAISTLLEKAEAEKLETEAILNAPIAADSIEILERKDGAIPMLNSTDTIDATGISEIDSSGNGVRRDGLTAVTIATVPNGDYNSTFDVIALTVSNQTSTDGGTSARGDESALGDDNDGTNEKVTLTPEEEALAEELETEAILNAPIAADSIEILEKKEGPGLIATNATDAADELAILEMDVPTNTTLSGEVLVTNVSAEKIAMPIGDTVLLPMDVISSLSMEPNSNTTELYEPPIDGDKSL
ncbi:hypothetical protein MPSEU_001098400 [Mayamaea pseudoterrestris]|nr:hypothetical protein MPSEU_001098400 [Mayamaea pseudoterrestris]